MSLMPMVAQAAADTVVMIQARDGLETASMVASVVLTSIFVLILAALVFLLFQLRGIQRTVKELVGRLEKRADPIFDKGKEIAANVEFISGAVRTDVQHVSDSVQAVSARLNKASERMEVRIAEFNALMDVVQSEAENVFIGSTAAMRGVRAGARALRGRRVEEPELTDDELALIDEEDAELLAEAGLPPRELGAAAVETQRAPLAAPGGVQVTGGAESPAAKSAPAGSAAASRRTP
jgi:hypothetical protein